MVSAYPWLRALRDKVNRSFLDIFELRQVFWARMLFLRMISGHIPAMSDLKGIALPEFQEKGGCRVAKKAN